MKFSWVLPTCMQGLNHPPGFGGPDELIKIAQTAEKLGLYGLWANDHIAPWPKLRQAYSKPLSWHEILMSTAFCAGATKKIKLGLGVIVAPFREPVLLAKQVATLDVFSGGRVLLGMGLGFPRDEFEILRPRQVKANRARMLEETLEAFRLINDEADASFNGKYYAFEKLALYPKPLQKPLPLYLSGEVPNTLERIAKYGAGLMVIGGPDEALRKRVDELGAALAKVGRDISEIDVAISLAVSLDTTHEAAVKRFLASYVGRRFSSRARTPEDLDKIIKGNLVGTPQEVAERVEGMAKAGMTHSAPQHIAAESMSDMMEQMHIYAEELAPLCKSL